MAFVGAEGVQSRDPRQLFFGVGVGLGVGLAFGFA
jgi:hypothetical protein